MVHKHVKFSKWPIYNIKVLTTMTCDILKLEKLSFVKNVLKKLRFKCRS